jgi:hypothetical protein
MATAVISRLGHEIKVTTEDGKVLGFLQHDGPKVVAATVEANELKYFGTFDSEAEAATHLIYDASLQQEL